MEQGYSFVWEANSTPYMESPDGKIIALTVDGYIPYLIDELSEQLVLPAVGAGPVAEPAALLEEERGKRDLKALANSLPHLPPQFLKHPWCDACRRAKLIRKACPVRDAELPPEAKLGDYLTVDHMIFSGFPAGCDSETTAVVVLDRATQWLDCFPMRYQGHGRYLGLAAAIHRFVAI